MKSTSTLIYIENWKIIAFTFLSATLFACTQPEKSIPKENLSQKIDSALEVTKDAFNSQKRLDSAMTYFFKQVEFAQKKDACEIAYLRTENDKYRIEGNRYLDSSRKYSRLFKDLNKKILPRQ